MALVTLGHRDAGLCVGDEAELASIATHPSLRQRSQILATPAKVRLTKHHDHGNGLKLPFAPCGHMQRAPDTVNK